MSAKLSSQQKTSSPKWTLDAALQWLDFNPHDTVMQYIAMRMAMREWRLGELSSRAQSTFGVLSSNRQNRPIDLFSIFSGATAVHESLQLEAMMPRDEGFNQGMTFVDLDRPSKRKHKKPVTISELIGPTVQSHPWKEMLGDKNPSVSKMAMLVPAHFFLAESHSASKLMESLNALNDWRSYVSVHGFQNASQQLGVARAKKQLLLDGNHLEIMMNSPIEELGIAGSDLSITEGSDITVLLLADVNLTQHLFESLSAEGQSMGASFSTFSIGRLNCTQVSNEDRTVNTFACNPLPNLHIRSNSRAALEEILKTVVGNQQDSLGGTLEYRYIRTLMPCGKAEEDIFIYLSDPFIRRIVGPNLRIAQRRRRICFNHLRMISSAVMLYASEYGHTPPSFTALADSGCASHAFNEGSLVCPDGGTYSLISGQANALSHGMCSRHGTDQLLTPTLETPVSIATADEADEYEQFVEQYNQYWRTYFDPIGIRATSRHKQFKLDTIVLPLIDNSIYSGMASILGGPAKPLANVSTLDDVILSTSIKIDKKCVLQNTGAIYFVGNMLDNQGRSNIDVHNFVANGIGDCISFNVCDEKPAFSLDVLSLLGTGSAMGGSASLLRNPMILAYVAAFASIHSPVYARIEVDDEAIVDEFFTALRPLLIKGSAADSGFVGTDFAIANIGSGRQVYSKILKFGPARVRLHWARIGRSIYLASQLGLIERLWNLEETAPNKSASANSSDQSQDAQFLAHAVVQLHPSRWKKSLPDLRQSWRENSRLACQKNLGPMTVLARALASVNEKQSGSSEVSPGDLHSITSHPALGVYFTCPNGGVYSYDAKAEHVQCSEHGTILFPTQESSTATDCDSLLPQELECATASLKFLEDGLHAELVLERR